MSAPDVGLPRQDARQDEVRIRRIVREEIASMFSPQSIRLIKAGLQGQLPMGRTVMRQVDVVMATVERVLWDAWKLGKR